MPPFQAFTKRALAWLPWIFDIVSMAFDSSTSFFSLNRRYSTIQAEKHPLPHSPPSLTLGLEDFSFPYSRSTSHMWMYVSWILWPNTRYLTILGVAIIAQTPSCIQPWYHSGIVNRRAVPSATGTVTLLFPLAVKISAHCAVYPTVFAHSCWVLC